MTKTPENESSPSQYQYNVYLEHGNAQPANFATVEDMLFEVFRCEETDSIDSIASAHFLKALESTGLRRSDPRLKQMVLNMEKVHKTQGKDNAEVDKLVIGRKEFRNIIYENIVLVSRALRRQFIIPDFTSFTQHINRIFEKAKLNTDGKVADYIPQLAKQDPTVFGVSLCTIDGQRYSLGDSTTPFTIQSVCKPLNYAIALTELGSDVVHKYVGQEPSGRKFNDLDLDYNKKPHNPIVNSGAIIINSLLQTLVKPEMAPAEKFDFIKDYFERLAGGEKVGFNNSVFLAEKECSDRNYALAYYMKENKCFPKGSNLKECLDFWFQCCSLEMTCETVAVIGATLANGGVCPITRQRVITPDAVRDCLSLLHSCGFYESSGQIAFKVGLPGKSSVAGSMMMVLPNTMGICIYSPLIDKYGNSIRGINFCEELVKIFNFHRYDNAVHIAASKINPRRVLYESKGDTIVSLIYAAATGDLNNLQRHMFLGHDMGVSDFDGRTPLHLAASEGHIACVKFLIQNCDVNPEPIDRWGFTPLSEADRLGHVEIVDMLREHIMRLGEDTTLTAKRAQELVELLKKNSNEATDDINEDVN